LVVDHAERGIAELRVVVLEEGEREEGRTGGSEWDFCVNRK